MHSTETRCTIISRQIRLIEELEKIMRYEYLFQSIQQAWHSNDQIT